MEIQELIEKMKTATPAQNEEITEIAQEMLDEVKKYYPSKYNKYMTRVEQVYNEQYGLTEGEAKEALCRQSSSYRDAIILSVRPA